MIKRDFSDWLSPMLVKELRRGLRGRVFELAFLLIQGFMIFCVFLSIGAATDSSTSDMGGGIFWGVIGFLFLIVMPCCGLTAHSSEVKDRNLELLLFTGLTPGRVVLGKWKAIMAQTLLVATAVLPYMILRYFIGGVNLVMDLFILGVLLAESAVLSIIGVAISSFKHMISKLIVFAISFVLISLIFGGIVGAVEGNGGADVLLVFLPIAFIFFLVVYAGVISGFEAPIGSYHHD